MSSDVLSSNAIQALYNRLTQVQKERDLLQYLNVKYAQSLQFIASGRSVGFFWDEVLDVCKRFLPNAYGVLLVKESNQSEWSLINNDEINVQLLKPENQVVALPKALMTFSQSPSCPIRKDTNIHQSPEWALWKFFLEKNNFTSVVMVNVTTSTNAAYLVVMLQQETLQLDSLTEQALIDSAQLIQAAVLRESSDSTLLEAGHYDAKTALLSPYSFKHIVSVMLKDSRRYCLRLALISLSLNAELTRYDDKYLKILADVIQSSIRDSDVAAYYGEGEFLIGVRISNMQDAETVVQKLLREITATEKQSNSVLSGGVSVGVAHHPEHSSFENLYRAALYASSFVVEKIGYRIEFHGSVYAASSEFYTF